ncbi:MAG TPA: energy transducer TonB [Acidocella sp.]|nr:energy transducer TonB [Acidocella sp.]
MTDDAAPQESLAPLHADPATKLPVTSPEFDRVRAGGLGVLLHISPVIFLLFVLQGVPLAPPPPEPTLQLVMDKSPYVGSGPSVLKPAQLPVPKPAPSPTPKPQPTPPPVVPPAPPPPAPPPPPPSHTAPPMPVPPPPAPPPPHPATPAHVAAHTAAPAAPAAAHIGDNQPVGHGEAYGRIIVATTDENLNRKPPYPEAAREHGEQGQVLLSIHVAANGRVVQVDITRSSGYAILDQAAQDTALDWVFNPAMLNGKPVASVVLFPILFQLDAP